MSSERTKFRRASLLEGGTEGWSLIGKGTMTTGIRVRKRERWWQETMKRRGGVSLTVPRTSSLTINKRFKLRPKRNLLGVNFATPCHIGRN